MVNGFKIIAMKKMQKAILTKASWAGISSIGGGKLNVYEFTIISLDRQILIRTTAVDCF